MIKGLKTRLSGLKIYLFGLSQHLSFHSGQIIRFASFPELFQHDYLKQSPDL